MGEVGCRAADHDRAQRADTHIPDETANALLDRIAREQSAVGDCKRRGTGPQFRSFTTLANVTAVRRPPTWARTRIRTPFSSGVCKPRCRPFRHHPRLPSGGCCSRHGYAPSACPSPGVETCLLISRAVIGSSETSAAIAGWRSSGKARSARGDGPTAHVKAVLTVVWPVWFAATAAVGREESV